MEPLVSVVLPVHNGEPFLREAIASVLGQSYSNFELLIVDDGSADASWRTITAVEDRRVRAWQQSNMGLPGSLSVAIDRASAGYIARMDQDDVSAPERLAMQVAYLLEHPNVAVVGSSYRLIDRRGESIGIRHQLASEYHVKRQMFCGNPVAHGSVMFRRGLISRAGGYDASAAVEDYDLWCRVIGLGEIANLPDLLYSYRVDVPGSMVSRNRQRYGSETRRLTDQLWTQGAPPPLGRRMPAEDLRSHGSVGRRSLGRSRRDLYVQVGLGIITERIKRGADRVARQEWRHLLCENWAHPIQALRILKHGRRLAGHPAC